MKKVGILEFIKCIPAARPLLADAHGPLCKLPRPLNLLDEKADRWRCRPWQIPRATESSIHCKRIPYWQQRPSLLHLPHRGLISSVVELVYTLSFGESIKTILKKLSPSHFTLLSLQAQQPVRVLGPCEFMFEQLVLIRLSWRAWLASERWTIKCKPTRS